MVHELRNPPMITVDSEDIIWVATIACVSVFTHHGDYLTSLQAMVHELRNPPMITVDSEDIIWLWQRVATIACVSVFTYQGDYLTFVKL